MLWRPVEDRPKSGFISRLALVYIHIKRPAAKTSPMIFA